MKYLVFAKIDGKICKRWECRNRWEADRIEAIYEDDYPCCEFEITEVPLTSR